MRRAAVLLTVLSAVVLIGAGVAQAGYVDHYSKTDDVGQYKAPSQGTSHILVIRVQVNDHPYDWAPWEAFFDNDAPGYTFRNYYHTQSLGRYDPIVTLTDPIVYPTCPAQFSNATQFPDCSISRGNPMALLPGMSLIHELFQRLEVEQPWLDMPQFDINGKYGVPDGWFDGVLLISNLDFTGIALPVSIFYEVDITWDLCSNMVNNLLPYLGGFPVDPNTLCPLIVGASPAQIQADPTLGQMYLLESRGVKVGMVGIASTLDDLVVPVHEFGHVLGFADLYREHYVDDPPETRYIPGLKYSMMGSYGNIGIPQLDAFSRSRIGWANPIEVEGTMRVSIPPVKDTGIVYYFRRGEELFFVENRGPDGDWDSIFTQHGLAVYHVDLTKEPDTGPFGFVFMIVDCVNCDDWRPLIMNEQADGLFELQRGIRNTIPDDDLFHTGDIFDTGLSYEPPPSPTYLVMNSNNYNGRYSGFSVTDVDAESEAPNIVVTLSDGTWIPPAPVVTVQTGGVGGGGGGGGCSLSSDGGPQLLFPIVLAAAILFVFKRKLSGKDAR